MPQLEVKPKSLRVCIIESLQQGEMCKNLDEVLLERNNSHVNQKDETEYWDYKEDLDLQNPNKVAQLAKWVLGFHNSKGGAIIIGVTNSDYKVVGIHENKILDTVRLRDKLKKYTGTEIGLFQGRIPTTNTGKVIWIIFIPKRDGPPIAAVCNGPNDSDGKPIIQKDNYYIRIHDEVKQCLTPNDFERLFSGVSFKHLSAYQYEVDEPYFRLLRPHHIDFVGREDLLKKVQEVLESRYYIVSLDGLGGVGKSALAIELVRRLYRSKKYQFIISLSAKNKVWLQHTQTRPANFSGFTEFITEIANVLDIATFNKSPDELKNEVIAFISGIDGLLLIDNIEDITDTAIFEFLRDVPPPVKVLVTSRVSRDLGARTITVPEMTHDEAISLLYQELERIEYTNYINEQDDVEEIIKATGHLPLAIKWAASLAVNAKSLKQVSCQLRQYDSTKREFLDFCFATMYDDLSDIARDIVLLCPYLGEEWNAITLSIAIDQPISKIERAIVELEDRGILFNSSISRDGTFFVLPLTLDFLSTKWNEKKSFRDEVINRIANSVASSSYEGLLFNWPVEERIKVLKAKAQQLEDTFIFDQALKLIKLALQWCSNQDDITRLRFMEGRIIYKTGEKSNGIDRMSCALSSTLTTNGWEDEHIFLCQARLSFGRNQEERYAIEEFAKCFPNSSMVTENLMIEICNRSLQQRNFQIMSEIMERTNQNVQSYWIAKTIFPHIQDSQIIYSLGEPLIKVLKKAANYELIEQSDKNNFLTAANKINALFESSKHNN
jgi:Putative DNA-binding domain/NB-ARC domain